MGQHQAYYDTECEGCGDMIHQDDSIYFSGGGRYCESCADDVGVVCPSCKGQKREEYDECYECAHGGEEANETDSNF